MSYTPVYRKPEAECSPITLIMRKYYNRERTERAKAYRDSNKEIVNGKFRERYHSDPEYREKILARKREIYRRKKESVNTAE